MNQLFTTGPLSGENLKQFVNRDKEIKRIITYIESMENVGIASKAGLGKSSILYKILKESKNKGITIFMSSPSCEPEEFLKNLLSELLNVLKEENINSNEINLEIEKQRLETSLKFTTMFKDTLNTEGSINLGNWFGAISTKIGGKKEEGTSKEISKAIHSISSLKYTIKKILKNTNNKIIIFVDELDKISYKGQFNPIERLQQLFESIKEILCHPNASFVMSLHEEFIEIKKAAMGGPSSKHIKQDDGTRILGYFSGIEKLSGFNLENLKEIIKRRINLNIENVIAENALTLITAFAKGNPRKLSMLWNDSKLNSGAKGNLKIEIEDVVYTIISILDKQIDDKNLKIIEFIATNNEVNSSNEEISKIVELKETAIRDRLKYLEDIGILKSETKDKKIYSLIFEE